MDAVNRWNLRHTAATKVLVRAAVEYCCVFPLRARTRQLSELQACCYRANTWAEGKCRMTNTYKLFLDNWPSASVGRKLPRFSAQAVQQRYRAVKWCVCWGLVHRTLTNIESIGVDEIQYRRGHTYMTLVYQLDAGCKRLLHVAKDRWEKSLDSFFDILPEETTKGIKFACTDMWKAYLKVIKNRAPQSLNILDRFHIAKKMSEALDKVRADETRKLKADGYEPILKHTRWCLLKRKENLTSKQAATLRQLAKYNTDTFKAYLMNWTSIASGNTSPSSTQKNSCNNGAREPIAQISSR